MIVHMRRRRERNPMPMPMRGEGAAAGAAAADPKPSSYGNPQIASIYAPAKDNRAQSLAAAYTYRADTNEVSQPRTGHMIGRGLSSLSEKLAKVEIKKMDGPIIRF